MSKPMILCVDDEIEILNSLKKQLKKAFGDTYLYEMAESAEEALELIEELQEEGATNILVIVSDWLMPNMKGDELLIRIHTQFPNIVKVMLTGQADETAIERAKTQANLHYCLQKPWSTKELVATIVSGLGKR